MSEPKSLRSIDEITPEWVAENSVIAWDGLDSECMNHEDMDNAIEEVLDDMEPLPETIEVTAFRRERIGRHWCGMKILDYILESLDEQFGDPDGERMTPTPAMFAAADALWATIEADFVPWACEAVETFEVDVQKWVREVRPDWLVPKEVKS